MLVIFVLLFWLYASSYVNAATSAAADIDGAIHKHDEDPLTSFRLMYPSDGAVEPLPVEFRYEIGTKTMEGYLSFYGDKVVCVELSGDWKTCTPLTNPSLVFDTLPLGNYSTRGFITDSNGDFRYHETSETRVSIVSDLDFKAYTDVRVEQTRQEQALPAEMTLLQWAEQTRLDHDHTYPLTSYSSLADNSSELFLVIGVKSALVDNFARRQAIRDTWAGKSVLPRDVKMIFIGCMPNFDGRSDHERQQIQSAITLEKQTYGDVLTEELNCEDSYPGLTNKVKEFLRFAAESFAQTPFVMIADDDIYVRVDRLVDHLQKVGRFQHYYMGQVWDRILGRKQIPVRDKRNRYYLPQEYYRLNSFPPFAFGPHYVMSMDCVRFIAKNAERLRGLRGMDDISIALWLLTLQVHVEHTVTFSSLRLEVCRNRQISFADLSPLGIQSIHENIIGQREFCSGFDKMTWHRDDRLLRITLAAQQTFGVPLDIETHIHDVNTSVFLKVSSILSQPDMASVTLSYFPSAETLSRFSSRFCAQAQTLVGNDDQHSSMCDQIASELRAQFQRLYQITKESGKFSLPHLELWRHNLFVADPKASPIMVAYSPHATYSSIVLECLFAAIFEHEQRPILVVPEKVLHENYKSMPHIFVFSILDADCEPFSKPGCQEAIARYIHEYSFSMDDGEADRSAKLMMIAGEPVSTKGLDDQVILLSTVSSVNRKNHAYISVASSSFGERVEHTPLALLSAAPEPLSEDGSLFERRFCAYLYARCDRPQREYMFDMLNSMEPVDALGVCAGSSRPPNTTRVTSRYSTWYNDDAVHIFQRYKFVIAFENSPAAGYVTEKLVNPFLAGSIPVYLGNSTTVSQLFNPDSFIDCGLFEKLRDCAAFVMHVHESPELYAQMRHQPPIRNITAFNEAFSWHPSVPSRALASRVARLLR